MLDAVDVPGGLALVVAQELLELLAARGVIITLGRAVGRRGAAARQPQAHEPAGTGFKHKLAVGVRAAAVRRAARAV